MIKYSVIKESILREKQENKNKQRKFMSMRQEEKANKYKEKFIIYSAMYQKINGRKYKIKETLTIEDLIEIDEKLKLITKAVEKRHKAMEKSFKKAEKDNNMKKCLFLAKQLQESEEALAVLEK